MSSGCYSPAPSSSGASSASSSPTATHRDRANAYRLRQVLGRGAYGVVHAATHVSTGSEVVIKRSRVHDQEGVTQDVFREIGTLKMLSFISHPNLIKMHEAFMSTSPVDGCYMNIVMERADTDLECYLHKQKEDLTERQCYFIAKQLLLAVDHLHSNNIIHRDLKPANILLQGQLQVKVSDFGLTRNYGIHSTLTPTTVTLHYRAPEILLHCLYNTKVDIWSTGCIIAELYRRKPLLGGDTEIEQIRKILTSLGDPAPEDWPRSAVVPYESLVGAGRRGAPPLARLVPRAGAEGLDLLRQLLRFNQAQRLTAQAALDHAYLRCRRRRLVLARPPALRPAPPTDPRDSALRHPHLQQHGPREPSDQLGSQLSSPLE